MKACLWCDSWNACNPPYFLAMCQVKPKGIMPLASLTFEVMVRMYPRKRGFLPKKCSWGLEYCVVGGNGKFAMFFYDYMIVWLNYWIHCNVSVFFECSNLDLWGTLMMAHLWTLNSMYGHVMKHSTLKI